MKKKMFAMLNISFMVMAAFGAVAVFAEDTAADDPQRVINEASGTVNYIPDVINVSAGGTASFIPTVNWVPYEDTDDNYKVTVSMKLVSTDSALFSFTPTDTEGVSNLSTVEVVGNESVSTKTTGTLKVTMTAVVAYGDANIATLVLDEKSIEVNVYPKLTVGDSLNDCYFGKEYTMDISDIVLGGSEDYGVSVTGLPEGLYILGTTIRGMAYESNFTTDKATITVNVFDKITGANMVKNDVEMNLHKYQVSVTFNGEAVSDGDTVHVKQNDSATFTYTIDEGAGADGATVKLDSKWLTLTPGEGNAVTGFNIIGNHLVKVVYSEGTGDDEIEQVVFTFNVFVVYNDIGFIVPDPGMVVTLTG